MLKVIAEKDAISAKNVERAKRLALESQALLEGAIEGSRLEKMIDQAENTEGYNALSEYDCAIKYAHEGDVEGLEKIIAMVQEDYDKTDCLIPKFPRKL